jgi:NAD(P)H-dependent flavin oxidoreductase YrpB (nitropropane dioxygenase family)
MPALTESAGISDLLGWAGLKNSFTNKFQQMREAGKSGEALEFMNKQSMYQSLVLGDVDENEIPCGENAGMINSILSVNEVVNKIIKGISSIMKDLKTRLS